MKLEATITNEQGELITKNGNEYISIILNSEQKVKYWIVFNETGIQVSDENTKIVYSTINWNKDKE